MFGWWRHRKSRPSAQADEDAALLREREDASGRSRFILEALEPRILLSADPVLGELARWVSDDDSMQQQDDLAVIYEQLDSATEASIAAVAAAGDAPASQEQTTVEAFSRFQFAQNFIITPIAHYLINSVSNPDDVWLVGLRGW